jgi:hypothetical protein
LSNKHLKAVSPERSNKHPLILQHRKPRITLNSMQRTIKTKHYTPPIVTAPSQSPTVPTAKPSALPMVTPYAQPPSFFIAEQLASPVSPAIAPPALPMVVPPVQSPSILMTSPPALPATAPQVQPPSIGTKRPLAVPLVALSIQSPPIGNERPPALLTVAPQAISNLSQDAVTRAVHLTPPVDVPILPGGYAVRGFTSTSVSNDGGEFSS